jgi:hypothetical protein
MKGKCHFLGSSGMFDPQCLMLTREADNIFGICNKLYRHRRAQSEPTLADASRRQHVHLEEPSSFRVAGGTLGEF